jgi:hypothetical protein
MFPTHPIAPPRSTIWLIILVSGVSRTLHAAPELQQGTENRLVISEAEGDGDVIWLAAGQRVQIMAPQMTLVGSPSDLALSCARREISDAGGRLLYDLHRDGVHSAPLGTLSIDMSLDPHTSALRIRETVHMESPCELDIRLTTRYRVPHDRAALVTEDTQFRPLNYYSGTSAIYTRGAVARPLNRDQSITAVYPLVDRSTDKEGHLLSMPVVALAFPTPDARPMFLAVATDPFWGMQATASLDGDQTVLERESIVRGSVAPFQHHARTVVLEWSDRGADGIFHTFYRTIPDIEPCAPWARDVAMGYYDYNSDDGQGWYRDLTVLAEHIPKEHRGKVACCLHGWYDSLGFYCYDQQSDALADEWIAFDNGDPGRTPIRMSKSEVHRKIAFAKSLGFRVVLYYADCTNLTAGKVGDSWCGQEYATYLYTNKSGNRPAGWVGPCGGGLQLDISRDEVRKWYTDYFRALLREYGGEVDGFVLDETNYFSAGALCLRSDGSRAYGDEAQMRFIHDLTILLQQFRQHNPDLCLFEGSHYLFGLVTHGSFTDFEGIPLVVNYRNTAIQCCWEDPGIRNVHCHFRTDPDYDYPYGLDVGLSNGHVSDMGPAEMPPERLAEVIAHFERRVREGPPTPKISMISGLESSLLGN